VESCVVTGAFSYSGRHIARRLLDQGCAVRTLTNSPRRRDPFGDRVRAFAFRFEDPPALAAALAGADVLINTYWIRFNHGGAGHDLAVRNSIALLEAARAAGVGRIVHVSVANASEDSPFSYFRGKGRVERALREIGLPHSILRPALFFGGEDILVNNIAWTLRRFPVFGVFGDGAYRVQPIYIEDFAELAADERCATGDRRVDAVGPETFTYRGLIETLGRIIGKPRPLALIPPGVGYLAAWAIGRLVGDVFLTREEIGALMAGLLSTNSPCVGVTRLSDWAQANAADLGRRYASELARWRERSSPRGTSG